MRKNRWMGLITILILAAAPAVGLACDKDKQTAEAGAAKPCCAAAAAECAGKAPEECHAAMIAKAVRLASAAEGGCEQSMAELIALAKSSGHEEAVTLAASAEGGSEASKTALIALAKSKPGQLNFTSAGTGSATHFGGEMFKARAGIDVVHVPHRGIPEALTEVMTGRVHYFMAPFGSTVGLIRDGKLRALAVSTPQRTRMNPEIPTIAESGLAGFRYDS